MMMIGGEAIFALAVVVALTVATNWVWVVACVLIGCVGAGLILRGLWGSLLW